MATTKTSWLSSDTLEGLRDELSKIAAAKKPAPPEPPKDTPLKRFAKMTALMSAGTGAGIGASMLADKYLFQGSLGTKFNALPDATKVKVLGGALGLLAIGIPLGRDLVAKKKYDILSGGPPKQPKKVKRSKK